MPINAQEKPVVTIKEAARLLGVKEASLPLIENLAEVRHHPAGEGYTPQEIRRLLAATRSALRRSR
jgi:hypothetical protein